MKRKFLSTFLALCMVLTLVPATAQAAESVTLTDVSGHWAERSITRWVSSGVVQGSDGQFDPNGPLTCGQLATILSKLLKLGAAGDAGFSDSRPGAWYYDAVNRCAAAGIRCDDVAPAKYFQPGQCDGAFLTTEYTYDAKVLKEHFLRELAALPRVEVRYSRRPEKIERVGGAWRITAGEICAEAPFLLNATYAGVNEVHAMLGFEPFKIKYELCEIILCTVSEALQGTGITVMDGPFFSIMPFGKTGYHSLTSVTFTPHVTSYESLPAFACQQRSGGRCSPKSLYNCNECPAKPASAWPMMSQLARKYLKPEYGFAYAGSLFSMKPILKASEIDDSRPTVIRQYAEDPAFVSVLSGKINTVYDLDEVLQYGG